MRDWIPHRETYMFEWLRLQAPPKNAGCASCGSGLGKFRCSDCFYMQWLCKACCVNSHATNPFHRLLEWTGKYFKRVYLYDLGFVLHLGHGGDPCPSAEQWEDVEMELENGNGNGRNGDGKGKEKVYDIQETKMVIVDRGGVYYHEVRWCACKGRPDKHVQLFRTGLFSASITSPKTAFTFQCLEYFHLDAMECRTPANNFFNKLRRLTDGVLPDTVPVSPILI